MKEGGRIDDAERTSAGRKKQDSRPAPTPAKREPSQRETNQRGARGFGDGGEGEGLGSAVVVPIVAATEADVRIRGIGPRQATQIRGRIPIKKKRARIPEGLREVIEIREGEGHLGTRKPVE